MQQTPILLYDIDGTLLKVQREFLFGIIHEQLQQFKIEKSESKMKSFAGRTDRGIFMEMIGDLPDADRLFNKFKKRYSETMVQKLSHNYIELCEGAVESVHEAVALGFPVGLCTGNFRPVALKKVQTAGLPGVFKFGGFGEISENRNELPGAADREYRSLFNDRPSPGQYVVIGDTPYDIRCAKFFGAKSVAVTSGGFSEQELSKCQPDLILSSLQNPEKWLRKLGF